MRRHILLIRVCRCNNRIINSIQETKSLSRPQEANVLLIVSGLGLRTRIPLKLTKGFRLRIIASSTTPGFISTCMSYRCTHNLCDCNKQSNWLPGNFCSTQCSLLSNNKAKANTYECFSCYRIVVPLVMKKAWSVSFSNAIGINRGKVLRFKIQDVTSHSAVQPKPAKIPTKPISTS